MTQSLRVSLVQMDVVLGEPELNFAQAAQLLEKAVSSTEKPDLIVLPEMWNTGYALDRIDRVADEEGSDTRQWLSRFCRTHQVHVIAGSISVKKADQIFNMAYAFNSAGELAADYAKIHLFRLMDEEKYLTGGNRLGLFDLDGTTAGMMICYDIRFPELARTMALQGMKILFVPAEWPHPRLHHWRTLLTARAIENQMFVVACNRVGQSGSADFFGHSMVIDPWGEIIAEADEHPQILTAVLDLGEVERIRREIPVFADRRPQLYFS